MKFLWFNITTKKELRNEISKLTRDNIDLLIAKNHLRNELAEYKKAFPFKLGDTLYDVQLRSAKGRYTKTHPSKAQSKVNPVVVNENNYFELIHRMDSQDVFYDEEAAINHIEILCDN